MHGALLERSLGELAALREHVSFSADLRMLIANAQSTGEIPDNLIGALLLRAPNSTEWRVLDHCVTLTRGYAVCESYVYRLLREYISFLSETYTLDGLGSDFIAKYTRGLGQVLMDHDKVRYQNLSMPSVLKNATSVLANELGAPIQPEALLRPEQNIRMPELQRLFSQCGINNLADWVRRHPAIVKFFEGASRLSDTAESELKELVQYRNEAAHGEVDEVLGMDVLIEAAEFFAALLKSVSDLVQYDTVRRAIEASRAESVGIVSERFSGGIIVAKITRARIATGDELYLHGKGSTALTVVKSIQLGGVSRESVEIGDETEVGLSLGVTAKVGFQLVRFPIITPVSLPEGVGTSN